MILQTDSTQFQKDVLDSKKPVLVDFSADWCGPCRAMKPLLDRFSEEHASHLSVFKLDVDENPDIAAQYGVMSIPTMILFENGQDVKRQIGGVSGDKLAELFLTAHLHTR